MYEIFAYESLGEKQVQAAGRNQLVASEERTKSMLYSRSPVSRTQSSNGGSRLAGDFWFSTARIDSIGLGVRVIDRQASLQVVPIAAVQLDIQAKFAL
jgi:hypothetical protein